MKGIREMPTMRSLDQLLESPKVPTVGSRNMFNGNW